VYRFRTTLRRLAALTVAALAGTTAALVLSSPASAHHSSVDGVAACDTTTFEWIVKWAVRSHDTPPTAKTYHLKDVTADPATPALTWTPSFDTEQKVDKAFNATVRLPGTATAMTLSVRAKWNNGHQEQRPSSKTLEFKGTCAPPPGSAKPAAEFKTACDGVVTVTLTNGAEATADADFTVTGKDGFVEKRTVKKDSKDTVAVPAANSQEITVTEGPQNTVVATGKRAVPANCGGLPVTGVKTGAIAGGALALLAAGAGLYLVARRRRIRFTAA
jgi:hypothetical protein